MKRVWTTPNVFGLGRLTFFYDPDEWGIYVGARKINLEGSSSLRFWNFSVAIAGFHIGYSR